MLETLTRSRTRAVALLSSLVWLTAGLAGEPAFARTNPSARVAKPTRAPAASRTTSATKSTAKKTTSRATSRRSSTPTVKTGATKARRTSVSRSRRARLARARAAQYQRELRELALPRYKVDESGAIVPDIRAEAAIVYNPITNEVLWAENANDERSIASITKVMTAIVFLEDDVDLTREITVSPADRRGASVTYLRSGERLTAYDLLHLLLISSDNLAARTLARASSYGPEGFVDRMNEKAAELGLTATHYADPSGLYAANVSSAYDMARLIAYAASDERISSIMRKSDHVVSTHRRTLSIHTTNRLVNSDIDVVGGKTGFISRSGYCLATLLRLPQSQEPVAVVVLGARSNAARFWETRHILNWLSSKNSRFTGTRALEQLQ